ncbi:MAG: hypothetical protein A2Y12_05550 [Planctomycetes bacterium GWF2_42_9]|nr:MAG: hypothetical protein A2Y12_05550 [Planctomycetes bacterium GWF2_42_9]
MKNLDFQPETDMGFQPDTVSLPSNPVQEAAKAKSVFDLTTALNAPLNVVETHFDELTALTKTTADPADVNAPELMVRWQEKEREKYAKEYIEKYVGSLNLPLSGYDKQVNDWVQKISDLPPAVRNAGFYARSVFNPFGLSRWLSKNGLLPGEWQANKGDFAAMYDAFDRYSSYINPNTYNEIRAQDAAEVLGTATRLGLEFGTIPVVGSAKQFALQAGLQAPLDDETLLDRALSVGQSALMGKTLAFSGKAFSEAAARIPALTLAFFGAGKLEGQTDVEAAKQAALVPMFEAVGYFRQGKVNKAVDTLRQASPELKEVPTPQLVKELQTVVEEGLRPAISENISQPAPNTPQPENVTISSANSPLEALSLEAKKLYLRVTLAESAKREAISYAPENKRAAAELVEAGYARYAEGNKIMLEVKGDEYSDLYGKLPGGKYSGAVYIPPVTTVGKIEAENPNISVSMSKRDIGPLANYVMSPTNAARATKNPVIIKAADTMAEVGLVMRDAIDSTLRADGQVYDSLPKEFKQSKGAKFFELMDKHFSPEQIDAAVDVPAEVKPVLKHFKLQNESMRQNIIKQKREMVAAIYENKTIDELQQLANQKDIATTKPGVGKDKNRTKAEIAKDLAFLDVPEDWGKQWSHIQHSFFGKYELSFTTVDAEGNPEKHFIGRAETRKEAYQKLYDFKKAQEQEGVAVADIEYTADPEWHIPYDVLRLGTKQFQVLKQNLAEAAELERQEISEALRGIVGQKATKQKWWGSLLYRKGAEGYSTDFLKVHQAEVIQFNRWKHLTDMNRKVQPLIESVKAQGLPNWATRLEEVQGRLWGTRQGVVSKAFDQMLERTPFIQDHVKPFALERWVGVIKSFQYWTKLQTPKFYLVNSLQPLQTLWPVVGEKGLYRGFKLYYSAEGQEILKKHNISGVAGKLLETSKIRGSKLERYTPAGASEVRNQGIAFLSLYDYARKLGMPEAQAVRYGRLRGQLFTQFAFTPGDVPRILEGPVAGAAFQFKRFTIKNLELVSRLYREGNYGGVARWSIAMFGLGGLKTVLSPLRAAGVGGLAYWLFNNQKELEKEHGKEIADVVIYGLPSLAGVDIGSSIDPTTISTGRNTSEKIGNTLLGPTGQQVLRLITDLTDTNKAKDVGAVRQAWDSLVSSSPSIKQFQYLVKALEEDTSNYDTKQRQAYNLTVSDLWKKSFAFTPVNEANQRLTIDAMLDLKEQYDETTDKIALDVVKVIGAAAKGNLPDDFEAWPVEVQKAFADAGQKIAQWQALYPDAPISNEGILEKIKNRVTSEQLGKLQRTWLALPKPIKMQFTEEVIQQEK